LLNSNEINLFFIPKATIDSIDYQIARCNGLRFQVSEHNPIIYFVIIFIYARQPVNKMSSASKQFQDRNPSLTGKVSNNSQRNEHDHNNNHDIIRSQHGEEAKNTEAYNKVSTIRRKKEPLDLSNRPPWVGIGTPIKKKDRPAPPGDRMKQINVVISSIDDTTGPSDKNRVSMEEITERLHKGIRAKVKIRKPKIPKFLQVHTAPIIVPEIKAKIKESYKRFISASQSSLPCNSDSDQVRHYRLY